MLSKMHTALSHWLKTAKELQEQYEASGDQRAIDAGRKSIARLEKQIAELEEQGAA
jgi:hypothetical protein